MGILDKMFQRKALPSYTRKWIQTNSKMKLNSISALENLFYHLLILCCSFGKGKELRPYTGDATDFEIAVYLYFETDLWLFLNQEKYRDEVSAYLQINLAKHFSSALKMENVSELMFDRLNLYGQIARGENKDEPYIELLFQLVLLSGHNEPPKKYDIGDYINCTRNRDRGDLFEQWALKIHLGNSIIYKLKTQINMLNELFKNITE